jgi:lipase
MSDRLHVHTYGASDGLPLLAIHGVSAHGRRFVPMAATAFPSFRVIAPDLRGHGRSPSGVEGRPVRIEDHLDDLVRVLDDEGVEAVTVVGHSFGGCLGAHLLARSPERVRSLVLLDPAIGLPSEQTSALAEGLISGARGYDTLDELVFARRAGRSPAAVPHSDADARLAAVRGPDGWRTPWDPAVVRQAWAEMSRPLPVLPVPRPTLLLDAIQAPYVGPAQREHFASQLGDALQVVRLDLSHMLFWDDFDTVCALIAAFVEPTASVGP